MGFILKCSNCGSEESLKEQDERFRKEIIGSNIMVCYIWNGSSMDNVDIKCNNCDENINIF